MSFSMMRVSPSVRMKTSPPTVNRPGEGAYTGEPRKIVYCIVRTTEIAALKAIVKANDPKALFSVIETKEVVGRGFGIMN